MSISDRLSGFGGTGLFSTAEAPKPAFTRGAAAAPAAATAPAPEATKTIRRNKYAGKCIDCGAWIDENAGLLAKTPEGKWGVKHDELGACSAAPAPAPKKIIPVTGLDLRTLPEGRYGIPGSDTRLKISVEKPTTGNWKGWVFVKDAAEYGQGQRYGSQKPGSTYRGQIEDELKAIVADPRAAAARYGQLTGTCGMCGRHLEDQESIDRGIGPVCAKKFG